MSEKFTFYEIVKISRASKQLAVDGMEGVVLGISQDRNSTYYAILIGDRTYSLGENDLESTGRFISRDQIYPGDVLTVNQDGKAIRYTTTEDG